MKIDPEAAESELAEADCPDRVAEALGNGEAPAFSAPMSARPLPNQPAPLPRVV